MGVHIIVYVWEPSGLHMNDLALWSFDQPWRSYSYIIITYVSSFPFCCVRIYSPLQTYIHYSTQRIYTMYPKINKFIFNISDGTATILIFIDILFYLQPKFAMHHSVKLSYSLNKVLNINVPWMTFEFKDNFMKNV